MSQEEQFREMLQEAITTRIPFGKYGPQNYPPNGLPICDLPYEYLRWFQKKGFPKSRLGELMALVCQLKLDGAEGVFDVLRGSQPRESIRRKRKTSWTFSSVQDEAQSPPENQNGLVKDTGSCDQDEA